MKKIVFIFIIVTFTFSAYSEEYRLINKGEEPRKLIKYNLNVGDKVKGEEVIRNTFLLQDSKKGSLKGHIIVKQKNIADVYALYEDSGYTIKNKCESIELIESQGANPEYIKFFVDSLKEQCLSEQYTDMLFNGKIIKNQNESLSKEQSSQNSEEESDKIEFSIGVNAGMLTSSFFPDTPLGKGAVWEYDKVYQITEDFEIDYILKCTIKDFVEDKVKYSCSIFFEANDEEIANRTVGSEENTLSLAHLRIYGKRHNTIGLNSLISSGSIGLCGEYSLSAKLEDNAESTANNYSFDSRTCIGIKTKDESIEN